MLGDRRLALAHRLEPTGGARMELLLEIIAHRRVRDVSDEGVLEEKFASRREATGGRFNDQVGGDQASQRDVRRDDTREA